MKPFSKDGKLSFENSVLLCKTCNLNKGNGNIEDLLRKSGLTDVEIEEKKIEISKIQEWAEAELKRVLIRKAYKEKFR